MPKQQPRLTFTVTGTLAYTDTTAKKLFTLPRGARPIRVSVFTSANDSGATLDLGINGDTDKYVNDMDVSAVGMSIADLLNIDRTTTKVDVYGLLAGTPTGATQTVIMEYDTSRSRGPK